MGLTINACKTDHDMDGILICDKFYGLIKNCHRKIALKNVWSRLCMG